MILMATEYQVFDNYYIFTHRIFIKKKILSSQIVKQISTRFTQIYDNFS